MSSKLYFSILMAICLSTSALFAQPAMTKDNSSKYLVRHPDIRKFYIGGGLDAAIFSTATIHHDGVLDPATGVMSQNINTMGTIRFTYVLNIGTTFNFNFSPTIGMYTGIDIKNIGYIEQDNGTTLKRRTYNVGAPLGFKIGNMRNHGSYFLFGAGLDAPFNYKEKTFKSDDRSNKTKFNEWFSDRVPGLMPYAFIGGCFDPGITVKLQYYINDFMNTSYTDNSGNQPYMGTDVHLILLSVGFGMHMHMHHDHKDHSLNMTNNM
jgi:hypothetical protein